MASIPADVTSTLSARIPRSQSMPRPHTPPHLLAWDTTVLSSSSSPLTSPSLSPVLSPASQIFAEDYYAPHAKSLWQLAQSEPVISPDYGDDRGLAKTVDVPGTSPQKDKTPRMRDTAGTHANLKRRNTLHVNIPTKYIGHTRSVSDEDPVLALEDEKGDSDAEPGFEQSSRGRSRIRRRSDVRLGGSLPPPDDLLRSPPCNLYCFQPLSELTPRPYRYRMPSDHRHCVSTWRFVSLLTHPRPVTTSKTTTPLSNTGDPRTSKRSQRRLPVVNFQNTSLKTAQFGHHNCRCHPFGRWQ